MALTRILILDDCNLRHGLFQEYLDGAVRLQHVHTSDQALAALQTDTYDWVFLDHDLDMSYGLGRTGSGTELVDQMVSLGVPLNRSTHYIIHSFNPDRAKYMYNTLAAAGFNVHRCTGAWMEDKALALLANGGAYELPERWADPLSWE